MICYILAAGKPILGDSPTSLQKINGVSLVDYQIKLIKSNFPKSKIYFLGGYEINKIAKKYKDVYYIYTPDWQNSRIIDTLRYAPFFNNIDEILIFYGDTIFLSEIFEEILKKTKYQVLYGVDTNWKERYKNRSLKDIEQSEIISIGYGHNKKVEFTGLFYLRNKAAKVFSKILGSNKHSSIIKLISFYKKNFSSSYIDLKNKWAEFNNPSDISNLLLGTKYQTLMRLKKLINLSFIPETQLITYKDWKTNNEKIYSKLINFF